jgi:phosphatidylinositol glycan class A protein
MGRHRGTRHGGASSGVGSAGGGSGGGGGGGGGGQKHRICMVSDFFYPNMGGVEMHIYSLAQGLMQRGHKCIMVTHAYGDRQGVRYLTNGFKVYYLPLTVFYDQVIFPTLFSFFPLFRDILIRERITIVHGHQSTSSMTNECLMYARTMGYKTCYTDHSLFGFTDLGSIHVNKLLKITLSDVDLAICVSNTCRENLVLRACIHPSLVYTIPSAVDASKFTPDPSRRRPSNTINIVLLSRLVYRKGIDLLVQVIPPICSKYSNIHFIIGGDGPKKLLLDEMREKYQLHDRVEMLGSVPHHMVRDVLVRGHIFLNCSLTESFCIALLEAACCGLFVVSTKVGGVPEVLPPSMIKFAEPTPEALIDALSEGIAVSRRIIPSEMHERIRSMYSWADVTKRTETVYNNIAALPFPTLADRLLKYATVGPFAGILVCWIVLSMHVMWRFCEWYWPRENIEICPDFQSYFAKQHPNHQQNRAHHDRTSRDRSRHDSHDTVLAPHQGAAGGGGEGLMNGEQQHQVKKRSRSLLAV